MAPSADEDQKLAGDGCGKTASDPDGIVQQELLAPVEDKGDANGQSREWLKAQGLISVRDLWMKARGYV